MPSAIAEPPPVTTPEPKPVAAPAPAPKPAPPSPKTAPEPAMQPSSDGDDLSTQLKDLDAMLSGKKPEAKAPNKPEVKPGDVKPAPDTKPAVTPSVPKQLREELDRAKAEVQSKQETMVKLEARIAELDAKGKDTDALVARLTLIEKERDDAKAEVRAAKAELSPEFIEKWDKPWNRQLEIARESLSRLAIGKMVPDENTGETVWKPERRFVWENDFRDLYNMYFSDPVIAQDKVESLFGKGSRIVIGQLEALYQKQAERKEATKEEKAAALTTWKEKESTERAQAIQREVDEKKKQQEAHQTYQSELAKKIATLKEANPEWYEKDPEDPEGNDLLAQGEKLFMLEPKSFEDAIQLNARNQLNTITALRERHRVKVLTERIAELEAKLAENGDSSPKPGGRSGDATVGAEDDFVALRKAMHGKL